MSMVPWMGGMGGGKSRCLLSLKALGDSDCPDELTRNYGVALGSKNRLASTSNWAV